MNGTVIAASRNLGVVVVQTDTHGCIVLDVKGLLTSTLAVGDRVETRSDDRGNITLHHPDSGDDFAVHIQGEGLSRGEAVSSVSII